MQPHKIQSATLHARADNADTLPARVVPREELPNDAQLSRIHSQLVDLIRRYQPRRLTAGERLVLGMCAGGDA